MTRTKAKARQAASSSAPNKNDKPRSALRLYFGPGLLLALALAGVAGYTRYRELTKPRERPVVESHVVSSGAPPTRFTPEVSVLLDHASGLKLTGKETEALRVLNSQWQRDAGPLKADLGRVTAEFQKFADQQAKSRRANLTEIQRRSGPVSELSREYGNLKWQYWQRAMQILNPIQRQQAAKLREEALGKKPRLHRG